MHEPLPLPSLNENANQCQVILTKNTWKIPSHLSVDSEHIFLFGGVVLVIGTKVSVCTVNLRICLPVTATQNVIATLLHFWQQQSAVLHTHQYFIANELDKPITYAEVNKTSSKICHGTWIFMSCSLNAIGFIRLRPGVRDHDKKNVIKSLEKKATVHVG